MRHNTYPDGAPSDAPFHDDTAYGSDLEAQAVVARLRAFSRPVPRDVHFTARLRAELMVAATQADKDE